MKTAQELSPGSKEPFASQHLGVEAILSALLLTLQDSGGATLSADAKLAFDRLWSLQNQEGDAKGAWTWFNLNLDPWETPDSAFHGAALAALAAGSAPAGYRGQPEVRKHIAALTDYLQREQQAQPLHNRLTLLWASSKLPAALPESMRRPLIDEVLRKQQADGGWTLESLGAFKPHPKGARFDGKQQLCDRLCRVRARTSGSGAIPSRADASFRLASIASKSPIWILDGGLHEQAIRTRFHAGAIHAGCSHEFRGHGFARSQMRQSLHF